MLFYSSSNPVPADAPFAKLLANRQDLAFVPGIPAIADSVPLAYSADYEAAAKLLGLDSTDPEFVARRVRHLSFIIRNSKFADKINWRSYLESVDELMPIFEDAIGVVVNQASQYIKYSSIITGTADPFGNMWRVSVTGTFPNLTFSVNGMQAASFSSTLNHTAVGTSGYAMAFTCSAGTGDEVSFSATVRTPYSGDCMPIYSAILSKPDLVSRITANKLEYSDAILNGTIIEDAIAAFILAINEI
jgi:hypothetical protein